MIDNGLDFDRLETFLDRTDDNDEYQNKGKNQRKEVSHEFQVSVRGALNTFACYLNIALFASIHCIALT